LVSEHVLGAPQRADNRFLKDSCAFDKAFHARAVEPGQILFSPYEDCNQAIFVVRGDLWYKTKQKRGRDEAHAGDEDPVSRNHRKQHGGSSSYWFGRLDRWRSAVVSLAFKERYLLSVAHKNTVSSAEQKKKIYGHNDNAAVGRKYCTKLEG
jgi:hypothetical protein